MGVAARRRAKNKSYTEAERRQRIAHELYLAVIERAKSDHVLYKKLLAEESQVMMSALNMSDEDRIEAMDTMVTNPKVRGIMVPLLESAVDRTEQYYAAATKESP